MSTLHVSLAALGLQTAGSADRETLLVIFVGIIAVFFLVLIIGIVAAAVYALRLKKQVLTAIDSMKASVLQKATPIVAQAHGLVTEFTPKVRSITDDLVEISHTVRAQVTDIDSTLSHVTAKARSQADRVNGMVSSTLDTTSHVVQSVENGIRIPIREVSGVLAGLRAGLDVLAGRSAAPARSRVRRAGQHVEEWEREVAAEAREAGAINRPVPSAAPFGGTTSRATRSVMDAGDEIGTSAGLASEPLSDVTLENRGEELRERRPV